VTSRDKARTTPEKLDEVRKICGSLGIRLGPVRLGRLLIVPLYSWYEAAFDDEPEMEFVDDTPELRRRWMDYGYCRWGEALESADGFHFSPEQGASSHVAAHFAARNSRRIEAVRDATRPDDVVITVSHFVPRLELLPEKRFLVDPHLPKVSGSELIEAQLRALGSRLHVFGHTHLAMDFDIDGVRYVNWPLGSDRERQNQTRVVAGAGALLLYDSEKGFAPTQWTFWSHFYRKFDRDPASNKIAPWVTKAYKALGLTHSRQLHKEDDLDKLPNFPGGMQADAFYRSNASKERHFRSTQDGDDLRP